MKYTFLAFSLLFFYKDNYAGPKNIFTKTIDNFIVKESISKKNQIELIACDNDEKPVSDVQGDFLFTINGLKQELQMKDGVTTVPQSIDQSTFLYVRHENNQDAKGRLYYLLKKTKEIQPIKISWWVILAIPLLLVFLGLFRKLILVSILLISFLFVFNFSKGLSILTLLSTVIDGLKDSF